MGQYQRETPSASPDCTPDGTPPKTRIKIISRIAKKTAAAIAYQCENGWSESQLPTQSQTGDYNVHHNEYFLDRFLGGSLASRSFLGAVVACRCSNLCAASHRSCRRRLLFGI